MKPLTDRSNDKKTRQRNFLLALPIIVLPFLTFLLWSVGLVGDRKAKAATAPSGLNMQLPNANLKEDKGWNKLSFYEQADKDSALHTTAIRNDSFFQQKGDSASFGGANKNSGSYNPLPLNYEDAQENKITQRLAQLNEAIKSDRNDHTSFGNRFGQGEQGQSLVQTKDVDRLERMMQAINQPDSSSDSETEQLNGMMDKILDIQHPERMRDKMQLASEKNKRQVFPVTTQNDDCVSLLDDLGKKKKRNTNKDVKTEKRNGFYSLNTDSVSEEMQNIIEAEVVETQTLVSGSVIKLSLKHGVFIGGIEIPNGIFLYGIASVQNERLNISITSVHYGSNLLPVQLLVYDMDGLPGIYMPGSINRDVAKQTGNEALNNLGITSFDPSLRAQAAGAGIAAAKALVTKKVKQVKVTVKAGYQVLLKDENEN